MYKTCIWAGMAALVAHQAIGSTAEEHTKNDKSSHEFHFETEGTTDSIDNLSNREQALYSIPVTNSLIAALVKPCRFVSTCLPAQYRSYRTIKLCWRLKL
jgi:hypothetical protein